jgi:uncharacterized protein DUF4406
VSGLRVYVAGPMTGLPDLNRGAHVAEAERLRALGHEPVSPAALIDQTQPRATCLRQAIGLLMVCNAISLLPGWQNSEGTAVELKVARAIGLQVWEPDQPKIFKETP